MTDIEYTATETPVDIRTSQLPMRVAQEEDGTIRLFPAVQIDSPIDDQKTARSRKFKAEPIGVSDEMAMFMLTASYGPDVAGGMLYRANLGEYVFGAQVEHEGGGYRYRVGWNVASDSSRESGYVLQLISFRSHARGYRKPGEAA